MEIHKEKIMRFSRVVHILLKITFIVCIVAGAFEALAWLWPSLGSNAEAVSAAGVAIEAPLLFKSGDVSIYLPMIWESGFDLSINPAPLIDFRDLLLTVLTLVGLRYALSVFKLLREDGSPFRENIVKALKKLAIALLVIGALSGVIPLLAAGVVWVLCLIFSYGSALQHESDTTL
jgi:hypothetical protein